MDEKTVIEIIKDLIFYNINNRYEKITPDKLKDVKTYTIYYKNISNLKDWTENIKNIKSLNNKKVIDELTPIFSKGIHKLHKMIEFMTNKELFTKLFEQDSAIKNARDFIIAQFIVINQVFGDANHRTAIYYLTEYSNLKNQISAILNFTEEIHKYDGKLKNLGLWIYDEKEDIFYPNIPKIMCCKVI